VEAVIILAEAGPCRVKLGNVIEQDGRAAVDRGADQLAAPFLSAAAGDELRVWLQLVTH
jgi:hypothetical protein